MNAPVAILRPQLDPLPGAPIHDLELERNLLGLLMLGEVLS